MKLSLSVILAFVAFAYSAGVVLYYEYGHAIPPDAMLYPIAPGVWVGGWVLDHYSHGAMWPAYAAGITTMTVLGALLGAIFESLSGGRRRSTSV